jgi:hypothetical protein
LMISSAPSPRNSSILLVSARSLWTISSAMLCRLNEF